MLITVQTSACVTLVNVKMQRMEILAVPFDRWNCKVISNRVCVQGWEELMALLQFTTVMSILSARDVD